MHKGPKSEYLQNSGHAGGVKGRHVPYHDMQREGLSGDQFFRYHQCARLRSRLSLKFNNHHYKVIADLRKGLGIVREASCTFAEGAPPERDCPCPAGGTTSNGSMGHPSSPYRCMLLERIYWASVVFNPGGSKRSSYTTSNKVPTQQFRPQLI